MSVVVTVWNVCCVATIVENSLYCDQGCTFHSTARHCRVSSPSD